MMKCVHANIVVLIATLSGNCLKENAKPVKFKTAIIHHLIVIAITWALIINERALKRSVSCVGVSVKFASHGKTTESITPNGTMTMSVKMKSHRRTEDATKKSCRSNRS